MESIDPMINPLFNLPDLVLVGEPSARVMPAPAQVMHEQKPIEVGGEDPDEMLYQAAQTLLSDGNYELAEPLLERLLRSLEKRLTRNHPAIAKVSNMMALTFVATEKFSLAETYAYRALTIWEKQDGGELEVARTLNNLASIYNTQGQYQDGEFCLRRAFSTMERLAAEEPETVQDSDLLPILENFCQLLKLTGRHAEAAMLDARIHGTSQLPMAANQ